MSSTIRTRIVKLGNSQGIRIPKPLLEQSGITEEVEIEVQGSYLVLRSATKARSGWEKFFASMAARGDDTLLDSSTAAEWDNQEWEW